MFLVGCCVVFVIWWPSKVVFFLCQFAVPDEETTPPHTFCPGHLSSPRLLPPSTLNFGWLLCPHIKQWPSKAKGPPVSLHFLWIDLLHQTTGNRPPHTFRPSLTSPPMHPLMSKPTIGWLLYPPINWRPPKAKAPPPLSNI
jgi:hypothetical protein